MKLDPPRTARRAFDYLGAHAEGAIAVAARALLEVAPRAELEAVLGAELGAVSDVAGTLAALDIWVAFGEREGRLVEVAAAALAAAQASDGGLGALAAPAEMRLRDTALAAALLGRSPCVRPGFLVRAAAFLEAAAPRERIESAPPRLLEALTGAFASLPATDAGDAALQWCGRTLERGLRSGALPAPVLARLLARAGAHALPGSALTPGDVVAVLAETQEPDGSWPAAAGDDRVTATWAALCGLVHLGPAAMNQAGAC